MSSPRTFLLEWADRALIPRRSLKEAFAKAHLLPKGAEWSAFLDRLLLWLGALAVSVGVILFFAYNWDGMHRFAKLGLAGGLLAVCLVAVRIRGLGRLSGQAGLVAAALLTGGLLALIGQIYQTGAEAYALFTLWAGLTLPWALVGRLPALWALWLVVANLALSFYAPHMPLLGGLVRGDQWLIGHVLFNGGALALWELGARGGAAWMAERWPARWVAFLLGAPLTGFLVFGIFANHDAGVAGLLWLAWAGGMAAAYLPAGGRDLFMIAGLLLAGIGVVTALLAEALLTAATGPAEVIPTSLLIGVVVILLSTAAGKWLRHLDGQDTGVAKEASHG